MENSQLICTTNQLTGFYMRITLALNGLNPNDIANGDTWKSDSSLFPVITENQSQRSLKNKIKGQGIKESSPNVCYVASQKICKCENLSSGTPQPLKPLCIPNQAMSKCLVVLNYKSIF